MFVLVPQFFFPVAHRHRSSNTWNGGGGGRGGGVREPFPLTVMLGSLTTEHNIIASKRL